MSKGFVLRLPEDLKEEAARMAEQMGVSLNQYVGLAVASKVGAQSEAARYFRARARRSPGRKQALKLLEGMGKKGEIREGDEVRES